MEPHLATNTVDRSELRRFLSHRVMIVDSQGITRRKTALPTGTLMLAAFTQLENVHVGMSSVDANRSATGRRSVRSAPTTVMYGQSRLLLSIGLTKNMGNFVLKHAR